MNERGVLRVFETPEQVAGAVAETFAATAERAASRRGRFAVALAGGTTPKAAYALLAEPPYRDRIPWDRTQVFFGDERCVPPDDDRSNYKMADDALLRRVALPPGNVHRMRGEDPPELAARAYAAELQATLGASPVFDLVLLGMGPDGHTASLFPGSDPHADEALLVRSVYVEKMQMERLTLTPSAINAARTVLIAVEGETKRAALTAVLTGPVDPIAYPIQSIRPAGELFWYADRAAAAGIAPKPIL